MLSLLDQYRYQHVGCDITAVLACDLIYIKIIPVRNFIVNGLFSIYYCCVYKYNTQ